VCHLKTYQEIAMFFPVAIEMGNEEQAFGVVVPDLPGCFSAGDTLDEAIKNAQEVIAFHLEGLVEENEEIPTAKDLSAYINDPEYKGFGWYLLDIDISKYMGKTEKVNVSLPSRLIHIIDELVAKDPKFKSRSSFLAAGAEKLLTTLR